MSDELQTERLTTNRQKGTQANATAIEIDLVDPPVLENGHNRNCNSDQDKGSNEERDDETGSEETLDNAVSLAMFEITLQKVRKREQQRQGAKTFWLSHHYPDDYANKCAKVGKYHVCRRCAALYPLGFVVAVLSVIGLPLWPNTLDPAMIWVLCIPASAAFVGEAIGVFRYSPRWQVGSMLIGALAYGKALGYELDERWSPEFWWPIAIFGGLWFLASVFGAKTAPLRGP